MDTVTTTLAGTLIAQAGFRQRMGRVATVALTVSAAAPDVDGLVAFGDTAFYLSYHRGITHSFFGGALLALLLAAIFYRFSTYKHYLKLAGLCYLAILMHLFTDLSTSYGTQVLFPFSDRKFAWDTLFIVDVFVSGIVVVGIILAYWLRNHSILIGRIALTLLASYFLLAALSHQVAVAHLRSRVGREGLVATDLAAFPMPFGPVRWSGVVATKGATYQTIYSLLDRGDRPFRVYRSPHNNPVIQRAEEERLVALFRWFARFPVVTVRQDGDETVVEYFDLQFGQIKGRRPFLLKVVFDRDGEPVFAGFAR